MTIDEKVSKWVFDYTSQIYKEIVGKLDYIFYTEPSDVTLVDDGERSINADFRDKMIETFEFVLERDKDTVLKDKVVRLKGTVEERMEQIKLILC